MSDPGYSAILDFWFDGALNNSDAAVARLSTWFKQSDDFDAKIADRFAHLPQAARLGRLNHWPQSCEGTLAMILVLDQFPRNLYRNTARAFAYDHAALKIANQLVGEITFRDLHPVEQAFALLPFEHSEMLDDQVRAVKLYEVLAAQTPGPYQPFLRNALDFANRHYQIIERFGRFPHRNAILGRASSAGEKKFLEAGGDTFGVALPKA